MPEDVESRRLLAPVEEELKCPRRSVEAVLEAVRLFIPEAKVYQYLGGVGLPVIVVVIPRGRRRSWVSYAITKYAEDLGIDVYSFIDLVVLKEDEVDRLFPYGRSRLKPLHVVDDLVCSM